MYAKQIAKIDDDYAAEGLVSTYWLAFTLGRVAAVPLAAIASSATILLCSMPLAIVGAVWPLLHPGPQATLGSAILVGLGAACGFPNTMAIAATYADLDGTVNGVISTASVVLAAHICGRMLWQGGWGPKACQWSPAAFWDSSSSRC